MRALVLLFFLAISVSARSSRHKRPKDAPPRKPDDSCLIHWDPAQNELCEWAFRFDARTKSMESFRVAISQAEGTGIAVAVMDFRHVVRRTENDIKNMLPWIHRSARNLKEGTKLGQDTKTDFGVAVCLYAHSLVFEKSVRDALDQPTFAGIDPEYPTPCNQLDEVVESIQYADGCKGPLDTTCDAVKAFSFGSIAARSCGPMEVSEYC